MVDIMNVRAIHPKVKVRLQSEPNWWINQLTERKCLWSLMASVAND